MLRQKSRRQTGVSLVELMVGMVVALIVLAGLSSVYLNSSRSSRITTTANQLNQDLRAVMSIMVNDIRRAGFWASGTSGTNPFTTANTDIAIAASGSCILYSYDATHAGGTSGVVDSSAGFMDFLGFRLSDDGAVQTLLPTGNLTSTSTSTPCSTDSLWENLTDPRAITVTALALNTVGSKCIAFLPATYVVTDTATFTTWTTTAGTGSACSPTASGAPGTYPAATNTFVETRQINISITAQSNIDPSLTRTLTETVLVRNNRVIAP